MTRHCILALLLAAPAFAADPRVPTVLKGHATAVALAWSPDGKTLATASRSETVQLWDIASRTATVAFGEHKDPLNFVAWSPDGTSIASGVAGGKVRVWDPATGKERIVLNGHKLVSYAAAWSPDGKALATSGFDGTIRLWDPVTGKETVAFEEPGGFILSLWWRPDGKALLYEAGVANRTIRLRDIATGRVTAVCEVGRVECGFAWRPDGKVFVTVGDGTARLWDGETGKEIAVVNGPRGLRGPVAWSSDGKQIASAGENFTIRVWDPTTGKTLAVLFGHHQAPTAITWRPDGKALATAGDDSRVCIWSVPDAWPSPVRHPVAPPDAICLAGHTEWVTALAWRPDGKVLASAGWDETIRLWTPSANKATATLTGHKALLNGVAWRPDGKAFASVGSDEAVRVWDAETGKVAATLWGHTGTVAAVAWRNDGKWLVSAGADGLRVWDVSRREVVTSFNGHGAGVLAVAWRPDGKEIASGGKDGVIRMWDPATGKETAALKGHAEDVSAVAWRPDGQLLASGSHDNTIRVWDRATRETVATLNGHSHWVTSVAWSPDGKVLASSGADDLVLLWRPTAERLLAVLHDHGGFVFAAAWSPDGKTLASAGKDKVIRLWDVPAALLEADEPDDAGVAGPMPVNTTVGRTSRPTESPSPSPPAPRSSMPFDLPPVLAWLLFLVAWVGHACIWVALMNYLFGCRISKKFLKPWRTFTGVVILAFPLLLLVLDAWPAVAYLAVCLMFGGGVFPTITVYRWLRKLPTEVAISETKSFDFWKTLGPACLGDGKLRSATRLPFNDVYKFDITTMTVTLPTVPAAWDGLTMLLVSDTHFHGTPSRAWFDAAFDQLAELPSPDVVLLAGDYVDTDEHIEWIAPLFGRLKWNEGGFAILGNHDQLHHPERVRYELRSAGYTVLGNGWQEVVIRGERCAVVGHEGPWFRPAPDLSKLPAGVFRLCLSHTPDNFYWGVRSGIDLMVSGHVHGGGVVLPLLGPIFTPSKFGRRLDLPAYKTRDTLLLLSRGISGKEPIRLRCAPEAVRIVLRKG